MNTASITVAIAHLPQLADSMRYLDPNSQRFANDLISYHARKRTLTERQAPWVGKLLDRAEVGKCPTEPGKAVTIGDVSALKALFDRAACHLKAPSVVMQVPDVGLVKVHIAKANSRLYAGKTVVQDAVQPAWPAKFRTFGVITPDGQFESRKDVTTPSTLIPTLKDFAADPIKYAKAYGKLTGKCCFCRQPLEDERSTSQGYGPICAKRFHLPWGDRPEADSLFLESDTAPDLGEPDMTGLSTPDGTESRTEAHGEAPFHVEIPE